MDFNFEPLEKRCRRLTINISFLYVIFDLTFNKWCSFKLINRFEVFKCLIIKFLSTSLSLLNFITCSVYVLLAGHFIFIMKTWMKKFYVLITFDHNILFSMIIYYRVLFRHKHITVLIKLGNVRILFVLTCYNAFKKYFLFENE